MTDSPLQRAAYVFLSYASADRERALRIADLLESRGVSVWVDRKSIAGGTSWSAEIVRGICGCRAELVLCSAAARVALGDEAFDCLWALRQAMTLEETSVE